jgi:hypothetical protein
MNATISARILFHVSQGVTLPLAFDAVLGAGSYEKMVGELYTSLRSE